MNEATQRRDGGIFVVRWGRQVFLVSLFLNYTPRVVSRALMQDSVAAQPLIQIEFLSSDEGATSIALRCFFASSSSSFQHQSLYF